MTIVKISASKLNFSTGKVSGGSVTYAIDASNLMFYYPFDTNVYNYAAYTVPYVNDILATTGLSITNTTTALTTGSTTLPLSDVYTSYRLQLPNTVFGSNGITISFWYKLNSTTIANYPRLFEFSTTLNNINSKNFLLCFITTAPNVGNLQLTASNNSGYDTTTNTGLGSITDTNWHHVCATVSSAGAWTIYLDNVAKSGTFTFYPTTTTTYNAMDIGRDQNSQTQTIDANMNAFVMFNRVLNATEIGYLYNYPKQIVFTPISVNSTLTNFSNATCILYFPFDSNTSDYSTGTAVSTNITTGGTSPATISNTKFKVGTNSLYGSTSNNQSYLQVLNLPTNNNGYTFSYWAYFTSISGAIWMASPSNANNYIGLYSGGGGGGGFLVSTNAGWTVINNPLTTNTWIHFAITISKTNLLNVYVNGTNVGANISSTYNANLGPLWLMGDARGYYGNPTSYGTCAGYVDDFRYYDGVLTPNQILQLYYYR